MYHRLLFVFICIVLSFCLVQVPFAQEPEEESVFIFEEEIGLDFKTEIRKTSCTKRVR
jgi:hypothetical protein